MIALGINDPPFIQGLKVAKSLLLTLREKKLKENISPQLNAHSALSQSQQIPKQPIIPEPSAPQQDGRQGLQQKLNEIGRELYECNLQNETYQAVFDSMSEYYQQNYKIIEENEKLKRNGYALKEKIEDYKLKIEHNLHHSANYRIQDSLLRELTAEQLRQYLLAESNRAEQPLLQRISPSFPKAALECEEQKSEVKGEINLRWQWLSKQVARKPVGRKQAVQQQEPRKSNYGQGYGM